MTSLILLHSTGFGRSQWTKLGGWVQGYDEVIAPDFAGYAGPWQGEDAVRADVAIALDAMRSARGEIHLVGHSYGGLIAMLATHEADVVPAALTVIEPILIRVLQDTGESDGREMHARYAEAMARGDFEAGLREFLDFWNGPDTWAKLAPAARERMLELAPKIFAETRGAAEIDIDAMGWATRIAGPKLTIILGKASPRMARAMCEALHEACPWSELVLVEGGHMAPVTHPEHFADL